MGDDYEPYQWQVGDPSDWGDSVGVPDIPYMGYINNSDDEDGRPPQRPPESKDKVLAKKARELERRGRYDEALDLINQALDISPRNPNHLNMKAIILDNWGKFEYALKYYDESLAIANQRVVVENKAQCLYRLAKKHADSFNVREKDLETINEALAILPDDYGRNDYLRVKGSILKSLGRQVQAKKCFLLASGRYDDIEEVEKQEKFLKECDGTLISVTGRNFYDCGFRLKKNDIVTLIKEPENSHDSDAIRVEKNGETVGYVANSPRTVPEGISGASMIIDTFTDKAKAEILFTYLDEYLIAKLIV